MHINAVFIVTFGITYGKVFSVVFIIDSWVPQNICTIKYYLQKWIFFSEGKLEATEFQISNIRVILPILILIIKLFLSVVVIVMATH